MGCWCEKLPNGGGVRHMQVVNVMPGKMLVMTGGLGPLQSMAATGSMSFKLSRREWRHQAGNHVRRHRLLARPA